ncbi:glycosyltransferase family 8 protein [Bacteroides sp.]|uniref:glycosyltransferase family 8 protein n=1 Tax=Bacteroides sp. TaxID=29523 RepID=UPI0025BFA55C|nr:glycosyltransferase family 8 protein [Bacteroides sp.]
MNTRSVPLVVAFTPNYFVPAATCIYSILANMHTEGRLHIICLLSEELPERLKQKLRMLGEGRACYSFVNLKGRLQDIYVDAKYTEAASYRLLLPDLLPDDDKVMYIDCDMIVRNDLARLYYSIDLGTNYLAAVFEAPMDFQMEHLKAIGCAPSEYINSGFLIMNLELMRRDGMVGKFMEASKADYLEFPDQDVLNQLCRKRILGLPPCYNSIRTFYLPQYKPFFLKRYTEQDWADVHRHGTVHYTGAKPWNQFTVEFRLWWQYYEQLPVEIKEEWKMSSKIHLLSKLCKTSLGAYVINGLQTLYRRLKYQ